MTWTIPSRGLDRVDPGELLDVIAVLRAGGAVQLESEDLDTMKATQRMLRGLLGDGVET